METAIKVFFCNLSSFASDLRSRKKSLSDPSLSNLIPDDMPTKKGHLWTKYFSVNPLDISLRTITILILKPVVFLLNFNMAEV